MTRTVAKLSWLELKLVAREPLSVVFTFMFPLVLLVVLAGIFGEEPDEDFLGARPTDYYLAGYIAIVIGAIGLVALPVHVAAYRERGVLRRFRASSLPTAAVVAAQTVVGLVAAAAGAVLLVAVGTLVYGAALPELPGRALLAFVLATLAFLAIGFLIGSLARTARAAQALGMILFFPLWLLSGAGPPPSVMSDGMRQVSDVLPLTFAVRALQDPWLGLGSSPTDLAVLAGLLLVGTALSISSLRRA